MAYGRRGERFEFCVGINRRGLFQWLGITGRRKGRAKGGEVERDEKERNKARDGGEEL